MYKVAVIGDYDSIYGFAALGLDIFPVSDAQNGQSVLKRLVNGDYAVIYITEALYSSLSLEVDKYQERILPAIIQIPGTSGNTGAGIRNVKKSVEQAVGSDILFGQDT